MKKFVEPFLHLLFWSLIFYVTFNNFGIRVRILKMNDTFVSTKEYNEIFLFATLVFITFKMLLFYGSTYMFLPLVFEKSQKKEALIKLGLFFLATLGLSVMINYYLINTYDNFESKKAYNFFTYGIVMHFLILFIAVAYRLSKDWFKNEIRINRLTKEKLQTELDFLKSQVNPHFLFNTLNNLFAEARKHEDKTVANGIAKLSHIMRYMIYDSNVPFVSLEKETQYLESYIELQKLRISENDPFEFSFEKQEVDLSVKVAPILFIPFVENAFKYGISLSENSFIHIALKGTNEWLEFKITNSKFNSLSLDEHSGVGLQNVKRRLELLYPNKYNLDIADHKNDYQVTLKLTLN